MISLPFLTNCCMVGILDLILFWDCKSTVPSLINQIFLFFAVIRRTSPTTYPSPLPLHREHPAMRISPAPFPDIRKDPLDGRGGLPGIGIEFHSIDFILKIFDYRNGSRRARPEHLFQLPGLISPHDIVDADGRLLH